MKGIMKTFGMLLLLLVSFSLVADNARAADYDIQAVEVCDIVADYTHSEAIYVERGTSCRVEVYLSGNDNVDNVKIKAWLGGYEYGDVEDSTSMFDVLPGVKYKKVLRLDFPEDMDSSDDYTLYVEAYDDDNRVEKDFLLRVEETRHLVAIRDVIVRPGTSVEAGRALFVVVRAENMGARKEEDIQVNVAIPELGISARDYIDELTDYELDNEDEEDSMSSTEIYLSIPSDVKTGDYELLVDLIYNRGHSVSKASEIIHVIGVEEEPQEEESYLISFDASTKDVALNQEVAFLIRIANLNGESHVYSVEVSGEQLFADARVENDFVRIGKDSTGELAVYMKAKQEGSHTFVIKVLSDGKTVEEKTLTLNVQKSFIDTKNTLVVGFIVLVVILIILGLILAFSKMREEGVEEEGYY